MRRIRPGDRFGRLFVVSLAGPHPTRRGRTFLCRCECGTEKVIHGDELKRLVTVSCGCYHATKNTTHGQRHTPEYNVWNSMRQRCRNPNVRVYPRYGGRGITVCDRWMTFENFHADMGLRPSPDHSLERLDNDGPYAPGNVVWAVRADQRKNMRTNVRLTLNGETLTLTEWARRRGWESQIITQRLTRGWSVERALTEARHAPASM